MTSIFLELNYHVIILFLPLRILGVSILYVLFIVSHSRNFFSLAATRGLSGVGISPRVVLATVAYRARRSGYDMYPGRDCI